MKTSVPLTRLWITGLGLAALSSTPVQAEVCPAGDTNQSCHYTGPNAEIAKEPGAAVPLVPYTPFIWNEASVRIEPPAGEVATRPGLDITVGAGGWGEGSKEPMAIARVRYRYLTQDNVPWLTPAQAGVGYEFPCVAGTPLCYTQMGNVDTYTYIWTNPHAVIRRRYRITQVNPAPLPTTVKTVPVKVDYRLGIHVDADLYFPPEDHEGLTGDVSVSFGHFGPGRAVDHGVRCFGDSKELRCGALGQGQQPVPGHSSAGTFAHDTPLASLQSLLLQLSARIYTASGAPCKDRMTSQGTQCLVRPFGSAGHAVADPYIYIDPSWEYASWFKMEMSADEDDSTWVTPERTAIDTETLTLVTGGSSDAGVGPGDVDAGAEGEPETEQDAGSSEQPMGDAGEEPSEGEPSEDDGEKPAAGKSGGGCQLGGQPGRVVGLFGMLFAAAAIVRRKRRSRR